MARVSSGEAVVDGYMNNPEATSAWCSSSGEADDADSGRRDGSGSMWHCTQDHAYVEHGELVLTGRESLVIVSQGAFFYGT